MLVIQMGEEYVSCEQSANEVLPLSLPLIYSLKKIQ